VSTQLPFGSPTGLTGEGAGFTAYSGTKAGTHDMARTVAAAYATEGIRVNTVVPGYTETPLVTSISDNAAERAAIVSRIPLGRPEDVEGIMVYLAPAMNLATPPVVCSGWTGV